MRRRDHISVRHVYICEKSTSPSIYQQREESPSGVCLGKTDEIKTRGVGPFFFGGLVLQKVKTKVHQSLPVSTTEKIVPEILGSMVDKPFSLPVQ